MKKIIIPLVLAAFAACFLLMTVSPAPRYDNFDPETEGILDVYLHTAYGEDGGPFYYTLAGSKRIREAEPFVPDEMRSYSVPGSCFESYIDGKVRNRLKHVALLDGDGRDVPVTPEIEKLFARLAELEHSLLEVQIFETGGEYFAYVELNVNMWTPCSLYHYDRENGQLTELYKWDNKKVLGLRIRSLDHIPA